MYRTALALTSAALLTLIAPFVLAAPAAADPPTRFSDSVTFVDLNPCTGEPHQVTMTVTGSEHLHDGRLVGHAKRTFTTDSGFVGHGSVSYVDNGQISKGTFTDILTSPDGDRIRAHGVLVIDPSTDTVRADQIGITCLGPA